MGIQFKFCFVNKFSNYNNLYCIFAIFTYYFTDEIIQLCWCSDMNFVEFDNCDPVLFIVINTTPEFNNTTYLTLEFKFINKSYYLISKSPIIINYNNVTESYYIYSINSFSSVYNLSKVRYLILEPVKITWMVNLKFYLFKFL